MDREVSDEFHVKVVDRFPRLKGQNLGLLVKGLANLLHKFLSEMLKLLRLVVFMHGLISHGLPNRRHRKSRLLALLCFEVYH